MQNTYGTRNTHSPALRWIPTLLLALLPLLTLAVAVPEAPGQDDSPPFEPVPMELRVEYFRAVQGQPGALESALEGFEAALADDPDHAEALVYHGSLGLVRAGNLMSAGDSQAGMELWMASIAEMDRAVELAPDQLGVRIPRGATLMFASREVPPQQAPALLRRTLEDYGFAYGRQKDHLEMLSSHARGELLLGLADTHRRLGDAERARELFAQLAELEPDSGYGIEARAQLDAGPEGLDRPVRVCQGCHHPQDETAPAR